MRRSFCIVMSVLILGGCASANQRIAQAEKNLAEPIHCDEAEQQVSTLSALQTSSAEKFANTLATLIPTTALLNVVAGEYKSRAAIAYGGLDERLIARVDEIEAHCQNASAMDVVAE